MQNFSQGREQEKILEFFKERKIVFGDFGSNNGITYSNTHALALLDNGGVCVEPSPEAYEQLWQLYKGNVLIELFNVAVAETCGEMTLYHSGTHLNKGDVSLLSTLKKSETDRWIASGEKFEEIKVKTLTVEEILKQTPFTDIHMISLDVEGYEIETLKQLDLRKLKTELIVVECNGDEQKIEKVRSICAEQGLTEILLSNAENIIVAKPKINE